MQEHKTISIHVLLICLQSVTLTGNVDFYIFIEFLCMYK